MFTMIRSITVCIFFTVATLCNGDDKATQFDKVSQPAKSPDSSAHVGAFADASPAELQQIAKINEATRAVLSQYLDKEFDKYEARIAQLEAQLASRTSSKPQPRHATPNPYVPSPAALDTYQKFTNSAGEKSTTSAAPPQLPNASRQPSPYRPAQTWQRVNLNGQWFYIVPVGHVDAFAPPRLKK